MSGTPDKPRAVVFDWDNTLVDTWPTIHRALGVTLEAMGHEPWSLEKTRSSVRLSLRDCFPALFGERWQEARKIYYDAFERSHIEALAPADGAAEMLRSLKAAGLYLAVVSNKRGQYLRKESAHLGWDNYFQRLVGAGDAVRDKPAAEALALAMEGSEIEPGPDVWFVGDCGVDMEMAHHTGCHPVLLHRSDGDSEEFANCPPALYFNSCKSLANHINHS